MSRNNWSANKKHRRCTKSATIDKTTTDPRSRPATFALTVSLRCWSLRSIRIGPRLDSGAARLRSTTLSPEAVVSVRLRISYRERFSAFLVAQAQRDLLVSRIAEVRALANYLKALIDLYRQDGLLL